MIVDKFKQSRTFRGEEGETLRVHYDNRGEPYQEGVTLDFEDDDKFIGVFLETREAKELRDVLLTLFPVPAKRP